jgi:hypothetical protein
MNTGQDGELMSEQKIFPVWGIVIGFAVVFIGAKAVKHYAPSFNFGAVSNAMESTSLSANIQLNRSRIVFEVNNQSTYGYIDLAIDCAYQGASGTVIEEQTIVLYETFGPESVTTVALDKTDIPAQATVIKCEVDDAKMISKITCNHRLSGDANSEIIKTCSEKTI